MNFLGKVDFFIIQLAQLIFFVCGLTVIRAECLSDINYG